MSVEVKQKSSFFVQGVAKVGLRCIGLFHQSSYSLKLLQGLLSRLSEWIRIEYSFKSIGFLSCSCCNHRKTVRSG